MAAQSAGVLLHRLRAGELEVFLVHPGGPFWARKDLGAWSIPKGECAADEDPLDAARRELAEETGVAWDGQGQQLTPVRQTGGKVVHAWAVEGECDPTSLRCNTFTLEWPPRSGRRAEFPEVDRGEWFNLPEARRRILKGQLPLLEELISIVGPVDGRTLEAR